MGTGGSFEARCKAWRSHPVSRDILSRLGEAFSFQDLEFEEVEVNGIRVRVATPRMLYRMKRNTVRQQDRIDAEAIRRRFGLGEE